MAGSIGSIGNTGWRGDPIRHSLSAKGVKTGRKKKDNKKKKRGIIGKIKFSIKKSKERSKIYDKARQQYMLAVLKHPSLSKSPGTFFAATKFTIPMRARNSLIKKIKKKYPDSKQFWFPETIDRTDVALHPKAKAKFNKLTSSNN